MTRDDPLAERLVADAAAWRAEPSPRLRERTLAAVADERTTRAAFARRAAAAAAVLALAAAVAWLVVEHDAPPAPPTATPWVVATVAEQPRAPIGERPAAPRVAASPLVLSERLPWIGAGDGHGDWARVMFHPFEDEWTRMKGEFARTGDVLWSRLARPLAAWTRITAR